MQDSTESGKSPFGRVSRETLSDAQWRERARWIRAQPRGFAGNEDADWMSAMSAALCWESLVRRGWLHV